jgi:hypothetical protein
LGPFEHGSDNQGVCELSCTSGSITGGGCSVIGVDNGNLDVGVGVLTTNQPNGNGWSCDFINIGTDSKAPNFQVTATAICTDDSGL